MANERRARALILVIPCLGLMACAAGDRAGATPEPRPPTLEPAPFDLPGPAQSIGLGLHHSCATSMDGRAWCWGFNAGGQLGGASPAIRARPQRVEGLDGAVRVVGGAGHTCALRWDGQVHCWGRDSRGQLGRPTAEFRETFPGRVSGLGVVVHLSAGGHHTCALERDGGVACWGDDGRGQLGAAPVGTHDPHLARPALPPAADLTAGWEHTCAALTDGTVWCWGRGDDGQLGTSEVTAMHPARVPGLDDAVAVAAGDRHSCALTDAGRVWCWGANDHGQLGDGSLVPSASPRQVAGLTRIVALATGHEYACALDAAGDLWCWGRGDRGQLGDGGDTGRATYPARISDLEDVVAFDLGWRHGCALRDDGQVVCWGRGVEGQIGDGSLGVRRRPSVAIRGLE